MNYWIISDTHLGHKKLVDWGRPADFEEQILKNVKAVQPGDTLIHLGDFGIGEEKEWTSKFFAELPPCTKILVKGNHDNHSASWYMDRGWQFVCDGFHLDFMGEVLLFSHRPMHPDMWRFTHNIHGHTHGNNHRAEEYSEWYSKDYHVDMSPELVGYAPLRLDTIIKSFNKK